MLKRLLIALLFAPVLAFGQSTTTLPTGTTAYTPQFRYNGTAADSLKQIWVYSGSKYNRWYTATEIQKLYGKSFNQKIDSVLSSNNNWTGTNRFTGSVYFGTGAVNVNPSDGNFNINNSGGIGLYSTDGTKRNYFQTQNGTGDLWFIRGNGQVGFLMKATDGRLYDYNSGSPMPYLLGGQAGKDTSVSNNYQTKRDAPSLLRANSIASTKTLFSKSSSGWDSGGLREIGNRVFFKGKYYQFYSGYTGTYCETCEVHAGAYTSTDGITWVAGGVANDGKLWNDEYDEDPFGIVSPDGNTLYVLAENKSATPQNITMHSTTNGTTWSSSTVVLTQGTTGNFDSGDVSSPTVYYEGGTYYLYYEGRNYSGAVVDNGQVGIATGTSLTSLTKQTNPIVGGTVGTLQNVPWAASVVPDDFIKLNGRYYLTVHAQTAINGNGGVSYTPGMLVSEDKTTFVDYLGSYIQKTANNIEDVMLSFNGSEIIPTFYAVGRASVQQGVFSNKADADFYSKPISTLTGVNSGSLNLNLLTTTPSTPVGQMKQYYRVANVLSYIFPTGFVVNHTYAALTAARTYTWQDATGEVLLNGVGNTDSRYYLATNPTGYQTQTQNDARYPQLSGSYANPTWITSLAQSKITYTGTSAQYVRGDGAFATFPTAVSTFTNDAGYLTNTTGDARYVQSVTAGNTSIIIGGTAGAPTVSTVQGITTGSTVQFGFLGVGVSNGGTARIIPAAGTSTVAPFRFFTGVTTQTSLQQGSVNFDGTRMYVASGSTPTNQTVAYLSDQASYLRLTASGTGAATTISIAHGLSGITSSSKVFVTAKNAASGGFNYVTTDATNVNIVYTTAPVSGTNNLSYDIEIKP